MIRRVAKAGDFHVVEVQDDFAAPTSELWLAIITPERLRRWFLPVSGELFEGGAYQLEGNASGVIQKCEPRRRLELSWEAQGQSSGVRIDFPADGRLRLRHFLPDDAHWKEFGPGAVGVGWDLAFAALDRHLEGKAASGPGWMVTEEGRAFIAQSAAAWCEAHLAAGAPAPGARAAWRRNAEAWKR